MKLTWTSAGTVIAALVGILVLSTAAYNFVVWIDDLYIDNQEAQVLIDKQTDILQIMNDNIVNIGSAIYDRKLGEINQWIKELEDRTDRNPVEDAFLISLREQHKEVLAKKEDLSKVKLGP